MNRGANLHEQAVRLHLRHAWHARQFGDRATARKALKRAERARELARLSREGERCSLRGRAAG